MHVLFDQVCDVAMIDFAAFARGFQLRFGEAIVQNMHAVVARVHLERFEASESVQSRFMAVILGAQNDACVLPALHGTHAEFFESIASKGLLQAGEDECVQCRNGATHGPGVYTANLNAVSLSLGFCKGFPPGEFRLLVCAVLQAGAVKHFMDAQVVIDYAHVCPIQVATCYNWMRLEQRTGFPAPEPIGMLAVFRAEEHMGGDAGTYEVRRHPVWGDLSYADLKARVPEHRVDQLWSKLALRS